MVSVLILILNQGTPYMIDHPIASCEPGAWRAWRGRGGGDTASCDAAGKSPPEGVLLRRGLSRPCRAAGGEPRRLRGGCVGLPPDARPCPPDLVPGDEAGRRGPARGAGRGAPAL